MECSVRGVSSTVSFSVTNNPRLLTLQRTELSHAKHNKIVWVPFDVNKMKLSRQEASYEYDENEEHPRNIYKYFNLQTNQNRRENKKIFNAEMFQPVTMALVSSKSPSSPSFHSISLIFLIFLIKIF